MQPDFWNFCSFNILSILVLSTTWYLSIEISFVVSLSYAKSNIATDTEKTYIPSKETSQYIGKVATVCGYVVDSRYAASSTGQPTFLNFDYPYPNHTFTIVIWGQNRTNFSTPPEKKYMSKNVCIDGYIDSYKGKPQIEATSEIMITIKR